jgi:hypothetical protein
MYAESYGQIRQLPTQYLRFVCGTPLVVSYQRCQFFFGAVTSQTSCRIFASFFGFDSYLSLETRLMKVARCVSPFLVPPPQPRRSSRSPIADPLRLVSTSSFYSVRRRSGNIELQSGFENNKLDIPYTQSQWRFRKRSVMLCLPRTSRISREKRTWRASTSNGYMA